VAGEGIVAASVTLVKVTRGGKNPLLFEYTSNFAEASGVVVPIPVWANPTKPKNKNIIYAFFIII
jgi:hypothetical protein